MPFKKMNEEDRMEASIDNLIQSSLNKLPPVVKPVATKLRLKIKPHQKLERCRSGNLMAELRQKNQQIGQKNKVLLNRSASF